MPCEMLTPGEYHTALPIAPTLEGLRWGRTVPFSVVTCVAGRLGPSRAWHVARVRRMSYSNSGHIIVCNEFRGRVLKIRGDGDRSMFRTEKPSLVSYILVPGLSDLGIVRRTSNFLYLGFPKNNLTRTRSSRMYSPMPPAV